MNKTTAAIGACVFLLRFGVITLYAALAAAWNGIRHHDTQPGIPERCVLADLFLAVVCIAMLAGNAMAQAGGAASGAGSAGASSAAGAMAGTVATVAAAVAGVAAATANNSTSH